MEPTRKLGDILIEKKLLCQTSIDRVVSMANKLDKKLGNVLEEMGLITEKELAQALAAQFGVKPMFNFAGASFPPELLQIFSAEFALANTLFPLKLEGSRLALAIADPTNMKIVNNLAANRHLSIAVYVSTKSEITKAICRHYFGKEQNEQVGRTVLLVEDSKTILASMEHMLSKDYRVLTAADGFEAYKEAISSKPQVILTDMEMPKLSGFGLLYALQAVPETKQIPIILISGTASASAEAQAFEKGFFDFIPKPLKEMTLLTRVKRACDFAEKHGRLTPS